MKLTTKEAYALLAKFGVYVTEACDACGQLLGPCRFTRFNDSGAWCSPKCRGDIDHPASRRGGRPRKYRNKKEARAAKTNQQRSYRARLGVEKTHLQAHLNKGLANPEIDCHVVPPYRPCCTSVNSEVTQ